MTTGLSLVRKAVFAAFVTCVAIFNTKIALVLARPLPGNRVSIIDDLSPWAAVVASTPEIGYFFEGDMNEEELAMIRYALLPTRVSVHKHCMYVLGRYASLEDAQLALKPDYRVIRTGPHGWFLFQQQ